MKTNGIVAIATNADTKVRIGRNPGTLADVKATDDVLVLSVHSSAGWTAKRILVIPTPTPTAPGA